MRFYGVHEGLYEGVQGRIELFREACRSRGVDYLDVDSLQFDYTDIPRLGKEDLLYCLSRGSETLMALLLNDDVTTFYRGNPGVNIVTSSTTEWTIAHEKAGLAAPRTIFSLTADRVLLKRYVDHLGGFPIILKVVGGTRGIGTIKVEGWHGLLSNADYIVSTGARFILREFIHATHGVRAIVVGTDLIASAKFFFQENDFRNAPILSATRYERFELEKGPAELCITAIKTIGLEMGGVDLLIDESGRPFLLEVNFPTGFQSCKPPQAGEVAGAMVDYLIAKAQR